MLAPGDRREIVMSQPLVQGVFQVGVLVTDIDECLRLFCGALGMRVVFEARNQVQPARGCPVWTARSWMF